MTPPRAAIAALILAAGLGSAARGDEAAPLGARLAGNTLSAVIFVPHEAPRGGGSLDRLVIQAFLRDDGSALIRRWDSARDAYTVPGEGRWSVAGSTLCLDAQSLGAAPRLCVDVHVWGPRIAGNTTGAGRFAMLDGDIEPGNALVAAR
jgi:hypothetical protein